MKAKQKVIFLINRIVDGGAETLVKDYAINLSKNDFNVSIVTDFVSDYHSANYQLLKKKQITIYCPFVPHNQKIIYRLFYKIRNLFLRILPHSNIKKYQAQYIKRTIAKLKPDVIHAHLSVLKYIPSCLHFLNSTKLFYTCHSLPQRYFNNSDCKEEFEAAKFLCKNSSLILIALHEEMRHELNQMFNIETSITLHNCINVKRFQSYCKKSQQASTRLKFNIPADAFVIGHIGRFIWIKNQSFIIDIFRKINNYNSNAYLILIGDGNNHEIVSKLNYYGLENKYIILSNRTDIPELLNCMNVFLFPSYLEGFPLACIEAQAMGLRCLISQNITKDVFLGPNAIPMSIEDSAEKWAKTALDNSIQGPYIGNIADFDIDVVLNQLTTLYNSK